MKNNKTTRKGEIKMTKTKRQRIINKLTACNCGCQGQDPWHKATYLRSVNQTTPTEGTVRMPYSSQPVRVTRQYYGLTVSNRPSFGSWIVDRDSIVWDR